MARGWESKAVENQQQEAQDRSSVPVAIDHADVARQTERATLMLSRTRALADLQHACAPAHRSMLEQAIRALDERLARLA